MHSSFKQTEFGHYECGDELALMAMTASLSVDEFIDEQHGLHHLWGDVLCRCLS